MITVYHQKFPDDPETQRQWDPMINKDRPAPWPEDYIEVAKVETDDRGVAWRLTNHIESAWTENEGVTPSAEGVLHGQHRSSMVGDIFDVDGTLYVVAWSGFDLLEVDRHGNKTAEEGCDRCPCGCKYWEKDRCIDCGTPHAEVQ